jgi:hypothetical protein
MEIQLYVNIPTEQLSHYKTNIIPVKMENVEIGQVQEIIKEVSENTFFCKALIYKKYESMVIEAMAKERKSLEGK